MILHGLEVKDGVPGDLFGDLNSGDVFRLSSFDSPMLKVQVGNSFVAVNLETGKALYVEPNVEVLTLPSNWSRYDPRT